MRLCIYGGTFSPPHKGHLKAALTYLENIDCDKMYVMPANIPPHKELKYKISPVHRLNMTKIAFSDIVDFKDKIAVCDYELNNPGKSYTVNTLRHFSKEFDKIDLLIGTDMFLSLHTWYEAREIMSIARIVFMRREYSEVDILRETENQAEFLKKEYGAEIVELKAKPIEISSTEIRNQIEAGIKPDKITEKTYNYILENDLYGSRGNYS